MIQPFLQIWKFFKRHKLIERKDEKEIRGSDKSSESVNEAVQKKVKGELEEIGHSYHGNREWLPESVKNLVSAALETDEAKLGMRKDGVMYGPDHYITRLKNAGEYYKNVISGVYPSGERVSMDTYIANEREESLYQMRTTFNNRLGSAIAALQPFPQERAEERQ